MTLIKGTSLPFLVQLCNTSKPSLWNLNIRSMHSNAFSLLYFICSLQENITSIAFRIKLFIFDTFVSSKFLPCLDKADGLLLKCVGLAIKLVSTIGVKNTTWFYTFLLMDELLPSPSFMRKNKYGFKYNKKKRKFISTYFSFFSL